jgi:hypothetical protein
VLFDGGFVPYNPTWCRTYGVMPDGRFLALQPRQRARLSMTVVLMNALTK